MDSSVTFKQDDPIDLGLLIQIRIIPKERTQACSGAKTGKYRFFIIQQLVALFKFGPPYCLSPVRNAFSAIYPSLQNFRTVEIL